MNTNPIGYSSVSKTQKSPTFSGVAGFSLKNHGEYGIIDKVDTIYQVLQKEFPIERDYRIHPLDYKFLKYPDKLNSEVEKRIGEIMKSSGLNKSLDVFYKEHNPA